MNWEEIAFAVNHALLKYNQCPVDKIYERMDWLWRACALLITGITLKKEFMGNGSKERKEKLERAIKSLEGEILPKLQSIYTSKKLASVIVLLKSRSDPSIAVELFKYNAEVNKLRDRVVARAIAAGFEVFKPLIIGGEEK